VDSDWGERPVGFSALRTPVTPLPIAHNHSPRLPVRLPSQPAEDGPPCEALMPFVICPYHRFPVCCPVTYHAGLTEGQGTVWNFSVDGCRIVAELPRVHRCSGSRNVVDSP
jgi:hypothetical protein